MTRYTLGVRTTNVTIANPCVEFINGRTLYGGAWTSLGTGQYETTTSPAAAVTRVFDNATELTLSATTPLTAAQWKRSATLDKIIVRLTADADPATHAIAYTMVTDKTVKVLECGVYIPSAGTATFGLGRPAAPGVTPTTPVALKGEQPNEGLLTVTTALAWGTNPTAPAAFFRRVGFPATTGSGINWIFTKGLYVLPGGTLVLWNIATTVASDVTIVADII